MGGSLSDLFWVALGSPLDPRVTFLCTAESLLGFSWSSWGVLGCFWFLNCPERPLAPQDGSIHLGRSHERHTTSRNARVTSKSAVDLSLSRCFEHATANDHISKYLERRQVSLHGRGAANRDSFDYGKEEFVILNRAQGFGGDFRLPGQSSQSSQ